MASATKKVAVSAAHKPGTGILDLRVLDGTRQEIKSGTKVLLTIRDGEQKELHRDYFKGAQATVQLPVHNNFLDSYTVIASADGYEQAGFQPVKISSGTRQNCELMLLKSDGEFHFSHAQWHDLITAKPKLAAVFSASLKGDPAAAYSQLMEDHADHLACLLNIATAMEQIFLPQGTPLDYFKTLDLKALAPDRIFGYADAKLVNQVRTAVQQGKFDAQPASDLALHGDATSSFKQLEFGEANVQLTFHENNKKNIGGVDCVYVEPDIDYYKDLGAHFLFEVVPNAVTRGKSSPRTVYVLRFMAGRRAGVPEFNPLYTIE